MSDHVSHLFLGPVLPSFSSASIAVTECSFRRSSVFISLTTLQADRFIHTPLPELHWLPVAYQINLKIATLVSKAMAPYYIAELCLSVWINNGLPSEKTSLYPAFETPPVLIGTSEWLQRVHSPPARYILNAAGDYNHGFIYNRRLKTSFTSRSMVTC